MFRLVRVAVLAVVLPCVSSARASAQGTGLSAPQQVVAQSTPSGVLLNWKAVPTAAQYIVLRAREAGVLGAVVGTVPAGTVTFVDRGFNAAAVYQVAALSADGKRSVSAPVTYAGPALTVLSKAPAPQGPVAAAPSSTPVASGGPAAGSTMNVLSKTGLASTIFHVTGTAGMAFDGTTADLVVTDNGKVFRITVPLANVRTGMDVRDQHMKGATALDVAHFPDAYAAVVRSELKLPPSGGSVTADVSGTFGLHGVGRPTRFHYTATSDGSTIQIVATFPVDMLTHDMLQQRYLGIVINKDVSVTTSFSVK